MNVFILSGLFLLQLQAGRQLPTPNLEIQVNGPRVVFFEPSTAEQDSIVRAEGLEIGELFDEFGSNAGRASVFLNGHKIPVQFTSSAVILLKVGKEVVRRIERKSIPEMVGTILINSGVEPRLIQGLATDEELIGEFSDFFQLK